jgi:flagellar biosynthesis anti-sigma factor FlgM
MPLNKVQNNGINRVSGTKTSAQESIDSIGLKNGAKGKVVSSDPAVSAQISSAGAETAKAVQKAFDIAKGAPDVREDKIADLRRRIQSGEYQADSEGILLGMMNEASKDELALEMQRQQL